MPGPRPLPANVHVLNGNPGKRKIEKNEIKAEAPPCPKWLSAEARKHWRYISKELISYAGISRLDQSALAAFCSATGLLELAEKKLQLLDNGDGYLADTPNGMKIQSVWFQIRNKAIEQIAKLSPEFGLTPSARTRLKLGSNKQLTDAFDDL